MNALRSFDLNYMNYAVYSNFAVRAFEYLNGRINPFNRCMLSIEMYSKNNYAEFRKPNTVSLYLGSILNDYDSCTGDPDDDRDIKTIIIMVLGHELAHSTQNTDMIRYTNDPYYRDDIEKQNEAYTEYWISEHNQEIYNALGVMVEYSSFAMRNLMPLHTQYEFASLEQYYVHTLLDVVYRNVKYVEPMITAFQKYSSILIRFNNGIRLLLKKNGEYNPQIIQTFNKIVRTTFRKGTAQTYSTVTMELTPVNIGGDPDGIEFHIISSLMHYSPIDF